jgi:hypothetical protein
MAFWEDGYFSSARAFFKTDNLYHIIDKFQLYQPPALICGIQNDFEALISRPGKSIRT